MVKDVLNTLADDQSDDHSIIQRERLLFIDLHLRLLGTVKRGDIVARFGIKTAAATRDLILYRGLAPKNAVYNQSKKSYALGRNFEPVFDEVDAEQAMEWIRSNLRHMPVVHEPVGFTLESIKHPLWIGIDDFARLTRAINLSTRVDVVYIDIVDGKRIVQAFPHSLVDVGQGYIVRAFDISREEFVDLRFEGVCGTMEKDDIAFEAAQATSDWDWGRLVSAVLEPHPDNVRHPEGLLRSVVQARSGLKLTMRTALAAYFLLALSVDADQITVSGGLRTGGGSAMLRTLMDCPTKTCFWVGILVLSWVSEIEGVGGELS